MSTKFMNIDNHIYIYGTGQFAITFYSYLKAMEKESSIIAFLLTNVEKEHELLYGYPVYGFDSVIPELKGKSVYIAISEEKSRGIKERLEKAGVAKCVQFTNEVYDEMEYELLDYYSKKSIVSNRIIMWNFWGLGYFDQCKYVAEALHESGYDLEIFWAISKDASGTFPDWVKPVLMGTTEYYDALCTSRVLITNVNAPYKCRFKKTNQYFIYTWHGMGPSKKLEWQSQIHRKRDKDDRDLVKSRWNGADIMIAGSDFCHTVYRDSFLYDGVIENWGYPRNDVFFQNNGFYQKIRRHYGIEDDKGIILYAPTFRNELMESGESERLKEIYDVDLSMVLKAVQKRFKKDYTVLYRFHHYIYRYVDITSYDQFGIDATYYPDMQELLVAADVLITDYSSSMWDFSLMRKPVFLYYHDAEEYEEKYQGFYVFPDEYPYPKGHTNDELCMAIECFNEEKYRKDLDRWFEQYGTYDDGHASERVMRRIVDVMEKMDTK